MKIKWTEDQQKVIDYRSRNILVSAAAGSGKTAVLVERIIGLLNNQDTQWNIDEILIVTFTKAAAAEMKERILKRIEEEATEHPENIHMQQQLTLIHQSMITTIDGFCSQVLKENFYLVQMEPGFRILEEGEASLIKDDALQQTLKEFYEEQDLRFLTFIENYATGKTDQMVEDAVSRLYQYAMSHPWPEKWLAMCADGESNEDVFQQAVQIGKEQIDGCCQRLRLAIQISEEPGGPESYCDFLHQEIERMDGIVKIDDYQEMRMALLAFSFGRLPSVKKDSCDETLKKTAQTMRNTVKDTFRKMIDRFFFEEKEKMQDEMSQMDPMRKVLVSLTMRFITIYDMRKRERNVVDFSDLEHNAIKILVNEKTQEPTDAAIGYQKKYRAIMIDEYQDSNLLQELILNSISRKQQEPNIFMVGDVKQSIYRFRQAEPKLFMEKYETYTRDESENQRIDLHQNFRSRHEIIETVNQVFQGLMIKEIGGVEYDEEAFLHQGAQFPESSWQQKFCQTQIYLTEENKEEGKSKTDTEIARIVQIVHEQMKGVVTDQKTGEFRPVSFGDIVVLLRSPGSWGDQLLHEMLEAGIPTRAVSRTGYFASEEVQTLLSYLRLIDNSRQDIPLVTSLTGFFGGITNNELAEIRLIDEKITFYECAKKYTTEGNNKILKDKLIKFYESLDFFQNLSHVLPIHELIQKIYRSTLFYDYVAAMPAGNVRRENLDMMVEKAITFENTSYHGVFQFIRYMDQLKRYEIDYGSGKGRGNEDAVQIMSIHKSKGLEFPIVILAGCSKSMNKRDFSQKMILHPEYGITLDYLNGTTRVKKTTLEKEVAIRELQKEQLGEEIRVLYVALTRAKEKLILSGTISKVDEKREKWSHQTGVDGRMLMEDILSAANYISLLMPLLIDQSCCVIRLECNSEEKQEDEILEQTGRVIDLEDQLMNVEQIKLDMISQRFSYRYPFVESQGLKLKMSVSEIKHRFMEKAYLEDEEKPFFSSGNQEVAQTIPIFLKEKEENKGALRGTAVHRFLECMEFASLQQHLTIHDLEEQAEMMVKEGRLEEEQRRFIPMKQIFVFLTSRLAQRMKEADKVQRLYKEKPFMMGISPKEAGMEVESDEIILVQGIIDVFFQEDDQWILVDYKTDAVEEEGELAKRYMKQMELYASALEKEKGKKVKEILLYSLHLGKEILITSHQE